MLQRCHGNEFLYQITFSFDFQRSDKSSRTYKRNVYLIWKINLITWISEGGTTETRNPGRPSISVRSTPRALTISETFPFKSQFWSCRQICPTRFGFWMFWNSQVTKPGELNAILFIVLGRYISTVWRIGFIQNSRIPFSMRGENFKSYNYTILYNKLHAT